MRRANSSSNSSLTAKHLVPAAHQSSSLALAGRRTLLTQVTRVLVGKQRLQQAAEATQSLLLTQQEKTAPVMLVQMR